MGNWNKIVPNLELNKNIKIWSLWWLQTYHTFNPNYYNYNQVASQVCNYSPYEGIQHISISNCSKFKINFWIEIDVREKYWISIQDIQKLDSGHSKLENNYNMHNKK